MYNLISSMILLAPAVPTPVDDSTELMAYIFFTLIVMIFGYVSKKHVFVLLSVGGLIKILLDVSHHPPLVIMLIGMIIFNVWYATLGAELE